ncbi:hypothetical protein [Pseudomonas zhanjiangensis]|uniref:YXWGXW repeat-containing protein n=1 Tax=Pseudomonas zhanjiangensis TaxID=3239015 RepID=A0ABV3YYS9_9PSED
MKLRYLLYLVMVLPLAACTVHVGGDRDGWDREPPAHYAPPPGVRWRWDPDLDVFVVLGWPHLYYRDRIYYRWHDGGWYWSEHRDGHWNQGKRRLPPGLSKKYHSRHRNHGGGGGY